MERQHNLDYLRGLSAFGIMVFHFSTWTFGKFSGETFLGRFGIYGVSIFYLLSGLTLFLVYKEKLTPTFTSLSNFYIKRLFRIFPLLWFTIIATLLLLQLKPEISNLVLNFTGAFGFVKWNAGIAPGSWSVGNELVFYSLFPIFLFTMRRSMPFFVILFIFTFLLYLYFAYVSLYVSMDSQMLWKNYVNPLNQLFLFTGGIFIGTVFQKTIIKPMTNLLLIATSVILFVFVPVNGDFANLITSHNRLIFTLLCFVICLGFYKITFQIPKVLHNFLIFLGKISYSIYLLHYLIFMLIGRFIALINDKPLEPMNVYGFLVAIIFTVLISALTYTVIEKPFIKLGHKKWR